MPRKSNITVTSRSDTAKTRNAALARRLASGKVFGSGTKDIPLKEPQRWQTYIAAEDGHQGRFYEMKQLGWIPLMPEDLACPIEESGFTLSPDGHLVRGPQGREMIFKMEREDYAEVQRRKTEINLSRVGSESKVRANVAEAASAQLGDEAATFISKMPGQVVDRLANLSDV